MNDQYRERPRWRSTSRPTWVFPLFLASLAAAQENQRPNISPDELAIVKAAEVARIQAIESVCGAVVAIYGNDRHGGGSGVVFDSAGYALTNHHVVAAAGLEGWAGLADGKLYRWKLIGTDPGGDLAIIKLEGKVRFPVAPLGDSDSVRVGDWALAMGNPFALAEDQKPTVTLGIVSGVKRFQEGSGLNQLVYGNCIQVDSSINPGNSGGPLFNLRGQIIGINGRGSFEERGRVNVGLGYAISSNQIKNFIPELLATKIAQHGTLDAVFGNREAGVICYTLNIDSPAAKAGLALGDKLLAFEGMPVSDANQFTSLLSTFPAGWPAELVVETDGQPKTIHVRLSSLPYEPIVKPGAKPTERPAEEPKSAEPKPMQPSKPAPPQIPLGDAGKARDAKLNRTIAEQLIARWRSAAAEAPAGWRIKSEIRRGETIVGEQMLGVAIGGRIRAEYTIDGKRTIVAYDGRECWSVTPSGNPQSIPRGKAILDPHFAQGVALAALFNHSALADWGELALDGADKAGGRLCYRLSVTDPATSEQLFLWLAVTGDGERPFELVKAGVGLDDDEPIAATLFEDWRTAQETRAPQRLRFVSGLAEKTTLSLVRVSTKPLNEVFAQEFEKP
jgi:serine protease Do